MKANHDEPQFVEVRKHPPDVLTAVAPKRRYGAPRRRKLPPISHHGNVNEIIGKSEHKQNPSAELSIHGVEKTDETGRLCRMNLAVHGLEGDIRHGGQMNN